MDTGGLLLKALVHRADESDKEGGMKVLTSALPGLSRLRLVWADQAYQGLVEWAQQAYEVELSIVKGLKEQRGFAVQPRRWVVERTFAWYGRNRQLSKDYHFEPKYSESSLYLASINLMLKRLTSTT